MPPQLPDILFALSAVGLIGLSVGVVLAKNPVRAILFLILSFLPTALLYVMMQAPFVGILQILVYGGAIMMLFAFVIMMINPAPRGGEIPDSMNHPDRGNPPSLRLAAVGIVFLILVGAVFIPPIFRAASALATTPQPATGFGTLPSLSDFIFKDPAHNPLTVSFELMSFLILVGVIAAINFSRRRAGHAADPEAPHDAV